MSFSSCCKKSSIILMEGALGERLKREYGFKISDIVGLADIIYRLNGKEALEFLWKEYIECAKQNELPFIATTPTRRANKERVVEAGYNKDILVDNINFLKSVKHSCNIEMYIGGLMGCKGDAYKATEILQRDEAKEFHAWQAQIFADNKVDFLYAGIMPALEEAIGMAWALQQTNIPYIISFMIKENGCLIDGTTIHDAISAIDSNTSKQPLLYMANCIHPTILYKALSHKYNQTDLVKKRFGGLQANTSALSPDELDNSVELRCSDCDELAQSMLALNKIIKLKIVGGCCGTDASHLSSIAETFKSHCQ